MAQRRLFTAQVPRHLQRMGLALVLTAALQPMGGALLSMSVGYFGAGTHHFAFSTDHVGVAVIGAILIAISAAAREAIRIADENARFI